jgi:hypothetical protein
MYKNYSDKELLELKYKLEGNISKYNNAQMAAKIAMNSLD